MLRAEGDELKERYKTMAMIDDLLESEGYPHRGMQQRIRSLECLGKRIREAQAQMAGGRG